MEAEIIQMENGAKKKGLDKTQTERKRHLEGVMDSSTWHVNNLEKVLRFLRNGQLTVQQVEDIKSAGALVRLKCFILKSMIFR